MDGLITLSKATKTPQKAWNRMWFGDEINSYTALIHTWFVHQQNMKRLPDCFNLIKQLNI